MWLYSWRVYNECDLRRAWIWLVTSNFCCGDNLMVAAWPDPSSLCEGCRFDHICGSCSRSPSLDTTQNTEQVHNMRLISPSTVCGYSSLRCEGHSTSCASFYVVRLYKWSLSGFIITYLARCAVWPQTSLATLWPNCCSLHTQAVMKLWS